jgi:hypothetical protein
MTLGGGIIDIEFDNSNNNNGSLCSFSSCSIDLSVASGSNRMIIVTIEDEGDLRPVTSIDITGGTNQGILVGNVQVDSGDFEQNVEMWRLMESDISAGTNTITVNFSSAPSGAGISVMSFSGVEQQPEEAENSNSVISNASIITGITTLTDGALIVSAVGNGEGGGTYTSHGTDQTERHDFGTSSAGHAVTTEIKSSAGFDNQSHTYSNSANRQAQYVAAFAPSPNSGTHRPIWNSTGHDGAGAYVFSGSQYALISVNDNNDIDNSPATTAGWFYAYSTGPSDYQTIYFGENSSESDDYEIYLDPSGQLGFRIDADFSFSIATCISNTDYRDDTWHHFVAVYPSDNDCKLYVDGVLVDSNFNSGGSPIILSGDIQIGAHSIFPVTDGFHGMIDDIIHWDGYDLNEGAEDEVLDLFNTNYGVDAHHLDFDIRIVDEFGNDLGNSDKIIAQSLSYPLPYTSDFAEYSSPTSDIWGQFNFTITTNDPKIVEPSERLMITMTYVPKSIGNLDMKMIIDDTDVISGLGSSFLQIPFPDVGLPGYWGYDNSDVGTISVFNPGPEDNWIKYQSRVIFEDEITSAPYAAFITSVDGTALGPNQDSPAILASTSVAVEFDRPRAQPGNLSSELIPEGRYRMYVFLDGYDSEGQVFLQTSFVGIIRVV